KLHFAVGQRAYRLALLANVGDQHHRGMAAHELLGMNDCRRPEPPGKTHLVVLAQRLIAQKNDEVLVPGGKHLRKNSITERAVQRDANDFGSERGRKSANCKRHIASLSRGGDLSRLHAQGSLASMRMKAMRQGSLPRLTQA